MIRANSYWVALVVALVAPGQVEAVQLEYQVEGSLRHFAGADRSLDGVSFLFTGLIDSEALPFFAVPGESASYEGNQPALARITGSLLSDGVFVDVLNDPMSLQARLKGNGAGELELWHNGSFDLLGPSGPDFRFLFQFFDTTGSAFADTGVPGPGVDETDFDIDDGWLTYSTADQAVIFAYRTDITSLRIIPEPATLALLCVGGVWLVWRRGRYGVHSG